jgi:hypothetical protein
MHITIPVLLPGRSGAQASNEPDAASDAVDAFMLLMGAVAEPAMLPSIRNLPESPTAAIDAQTFDEDTAAAATDPTTAPILPIDIVPSLPQMTVPPDQTLRLWTTIFVCMDLTPPLSRHRCR